MRPRACLATDSLEPSGVGEHMLALGKSLERRFAVVLACPRSPGGVALLRRAAREGMGVKLLDGNETTTRRWLTGAFDLLHVHAGIGWEGHLLAAAGREAGIHSIVRTEHLPDVVTDPEQRLSHAAGLELVDRVICVSHAAATTFAAANLAVGKLSVVQNGIPEPHPRVPRAAMRSNLGCDDQDRIVVLAARFTAQKDHATLIDALQFVLPRAPAARLWLAGAGPLAEEVRARAEALGVASAVAFLGQRDDVPDLLSAADLFVLPSRFEGLPLAAVEAMAAGLPVVATAVGGTDEVVVSGKTGLLVAPADPRALGAAIASVLCDVDLARAMGAAGRSRYIEAFTATRMATQTADLYDGLLAAVAQRQGPQLMTSGTRSRTRLGFVGAGGIAHRHLGVLETFEDVEIAAFADPALERAGEAAARFGARAYADAETMLDAHQLDALFICVPPFAHGAPERAALARKLPFFVEKPVALDLTLGERVAREVAAAGLVTGVGYHWRYLDTVDEVRGMLAENPAQFLSGYWLDSTPPPAWWWKQSQSGGQINEQTTHIVDLALYLAGPVEQVFGLANHKPREAFPGLDVATASTASLRFASGAVANIGSTCLLHWNHRVGLHVFADGLAVEITDHDLMVDVGRGRPYRAAEGDPVWREDRDFIDAVRGAENRIRCSYAQALRTLRVTDAIRRSVETGQAIDLRENTAGPVHV